MHPSEGPFRRASVSVVRTQGVRRASIPANSLRPRERRARPISITGGCSHRGGACGRRQRPRRSSNRSSAYPRSTRPRLPGLLARWRVRPRLGRASERRVRFPTARVVPARDLEDGRAGVARRNQAPARMPMPRPRRRRRLWRTYPTLGHALPVLHAGLRMPPRNRRPEVRSGLGNDRPEGDRPGWRRVPARVTRLHGRGDNGRSHHPAI